MARRKSKKAGKPFVPSGQSADFAGKVLAHRLRRDLATGMGFDGVVAGDQVRAYTAVAENEKQVLTEMYIRAAVTQEAIKAHRARIKEIMRLAQKGEIKTEVERRAYLIEAQHLQGEIARLTKHLEETRGA